MDDLKIPRADENKENVIPKDQRPQQNQRAIVLNYDEAVKRRRDWLDTRVARKAAVKKRVSRGAATAADQSKRSRAADSAAPSIAADPAVTLSSSSSQLMSMSTAGTSSSSSPPTGVPSLPPSP